MGRRSNKDNFSDFGVEKFDDDELFDEEMRWGKEKKTSLETIDKKELARLRKETAKIEAERAERKKKRLYKKRLRELEENREQKSKWVAPLILLGSILIGAILLYLF